MKYTIKIKTAVLLLLCLLVSPAGVFPVAHAMPQQNQEAGYFEGIQPAEVPLRLVVADLGASSVPAGSVLIQAAFGAEAVQAPVAGELQAAPALPVFQRYEFSGFIIPWHTERLALSVRAHNPLFSFVLQSGRGKELLSQPHLQSVFFQPAVLPQPALALSARQREGSFAQKHNIGVPRFQSRQVLCGQAFAEAHRELRC